MSQTSQNSYQYHKSRSSSSMHSFKHLNYSEFNEERTKILNLSFKNSSPEAFPEENGFSFTGNSQRNLLQYNKNPLEIDDCNTEKKRNMVLEIRLKEKEENLLKMTHNQEELNKQIRFYKEKIEEIEDSHEQIMNEYEEKIECFQSVIDDYKEKEKHFIKENKRNPLESIENQNYSLNEKMKQTLKEYEEKIERFQSIIDNYKEKEKHFLKENNNLKRINQESIENQRNSLKKPYIKRHSLENNQEEIQKLKQILKEYEEKIERSQSVIEDYKAKEKHFLKENNNLKRINQEFHDNSMNKPRGKSNSVHKFDNSSKRFSIENNNNNQKEIYMQENEKLKNELEKSRLVLENVYQDNERLINLIRELENSKKQYESLQNTNEFLQIELERNLQEVEKFKEIFEEEKLNYEELKQENDKVYKENDKIYKENERIYQENEENMKNFKKKEHQMQANYLTQLQELTANSQLQLKAKLKKYESMIEDLQKENKSLRISKKNPEKISNKENELPINKKQDLLEKIIGLLGNKSPENIMNMIKEMMNFQKNTHKFLNSIADLMKNIVPNVNTKPNLKEMWSFLKFTIKNYQETKVKYEGSNEELEIYRKIKQMLNGETKEEVIYQLNNLICEKKIFLQIVNKIKGIFKLKEEISVNEINQELNKWVK